MMIGLNFKDEFNTGIVIIALTAVDTAAVESDEEEMNRRRRRRLGVRVMTWNKTMTLDEARWTMRSMQYRYKKPTFTTQDVRVAPQKLSLITTRFSLPVHFNARRVLLETALENNDPILHCLCEWDHFRKEPLQQANFRPIIDPANKLTE